MPAVTGSFTAVGVGALAINVSEGEQTYSISGTFVGTVQLEKAANLSLLSWERAAGPFTAVTSGVLIVDEKATYRWNCTAYTSGTAVHAITPTLATRFVSGTAGLRSIAIGTGALAEVDHPTESDKIGIGNGAGAKDTSSETGFGQNIWIGTGAGGNLPNANFMVAIGYYAGGDRTVDGGGTYLGWGAGRGVGAAGDTGTFSTAVGYQAMRTNVASNNTAVGASAGMAVTTGGNNTFLGASAGKGPITSSANNVAVGAFAMEFPGTAVSNNVAVGFTSLKGVAGSTFANVTAIGYQTGVNLTSGSSGVFVGYDAGRYQTSGAQNILIGPFAGGNLTTGNDNIVIGRAVQNVINASNASGLTAIGQFAGNDIGTGANFNTLFGYGAGSKITTGSSNVVIGPNVASTTLTTGANNILIGVDAFTDVGGATFSNTMMLKGGGASAVPVLISFSTNTAAPLTTFGGTQGSAVGTYTAFAGGGQTSATQMTTSCSYINVNATPLNSVKLPASAAGMYVRVINDTANIVQIFGAGTDTINNVATATGVPLAAGKVGDFDCPVAGKWFGGARV